MLYPTFQARLHTDTFGAEDGMRGRRLSGLSMPRGLRGFARPDVLRTAGQLWLRAQRREGRAEYLILNGRSGSRQSAILPSDHTFRFSIFDLDPTVSILKYPQSHARHHPERRFIFKDNHQQRIIRLYKAHASRLTQLALGIRTVVIESSIALASPSPRSNPIINLQP